MKVGIVGAGLAGVGLAAKLKREGHEFTVFEKYPGPGGVWWANHYPGCEVDVPSHAYWYSFLKQSWSRLYAGQAELQTAIASAIERSEIGEHFRFDCQVERVEWRPDEAGYTVTLANGEREDFDVVVSCVGMLDVPNMPDWDGLDSFTGPWFHTARWEHDHDLRGKRVAFVGTGSTGSQAAPAIAPEVEHLYIFQREPGWVIPKPGHDFTQEERARLERSLWRARWERYKVQWWTNKLYKSFRIGSKANTEAHAMSLEYIESAIEDPEVRAAVTPQYAWGCKRTVLSSDFYPALNRDNVTLVPKAVARVTPDGIVDIDGVERKVDVLILSTGFQAANYLSTFDVIGPSGRTLRDEWDGDPAAILGMMVPGFPNFFILYGPNTNGAGSILANIELQADVVVRRLKRMRAKGSPLVATDQRYLDVWKRFVDRRNNTQQGVAQKGCNNYYFAPSGRNVTQYPGSHYEYWLFTLLVPPIAFRTASRNGTAKQ